jgi:serine/threonine protein kinase/thiol-disulfide isomerase/thioredoxin
MHSESHPSQTDPLFGNAASDLLQGALKQDATQPVSDPRLWQPLEPAELQSRLEGYVIEAFLARGGMGAVYRGMQTSLERPVAIKILPPMLSEHDTSFAQRFKQEARAMAQLNHPGIVKVFDFGEMSDGTLYFIMEFIDGTDVGQMVARQGRLSSAHALAVTAHVCDALQYAHELGIVHRDIKPANIMVGIDGQVKVADFGLAKSFHNGSTSLTVTGHVMGTLHFVAPEALTLGISVDHRADIYATGVMLYQMLTGRLPKGIFELPSLLVKGLDPRFDPIVASAMREDRKARYQSIRDMRLALDGILTQPITQVAGPGTAPSATLTQAAPVQHKSAQPKLPPESQAHQSPKKKINIGFWGPVIGVAVACAGLVIWAERAKSVPSPQAQASTIKAAADTEAASGIAGAASLPTDRSIMLPLLSSGGMSRMGGYRPQSAPTSATKPTGLTRVPTGLSQVEYGTIKLGPASRQREYAFIIDQPDSLKPRLFLDSNANGDLSDDPPAKWERRTFKKEDGTEEISASGSFPVELDNPGGKPLVVQLSAYRFGTGMPKRPQKVLLYYSDYVRAGTIILGGKSIPALLCDDDCKGDFSAPTSSLRLDLNGDGRYDWRGERFHVKDAFNISGKNYEIAGLTPSGADFRIVPSTRTAPESKPLPILEVGKQALAFDATTLDGTKLSMPAAYKGKVLLLDFWATWCPPCVTEVPHVISAYQKHHGAGFEILGISLDQDKDQLTTFLKEKNIVWPQVFDGKSWGSAVAKLYNVQSIPATFLIDGDTGRILATGARGTGLEPAIAKALAEKNR